MMCVLSSLVPANIVRPYNVIIDSKHLIKTYLL